jgi:predicted MFS family arabinose efflux permease
MGLISFVWGVSSLMGPPIGGFIVNYADWRWIFFMNLPIGVMAFAGIWFYLAEVRERAGHPKIDYLGALTLSTAVISLLCGFLLAGTPHGLESIEVIALFAVSAISVTAFYHIEKRAVEPILPLQFFRIRSFSYANGSAFLCSFAVFSLSAFYPLFIQGVMGRSPAELGLAMIPLSLGWSLGAWVYGQLSNRLRQKSASLLGSVLLMGGSALSLSFTSDTSLSVCSLVLTVAGLGMGFVSISTLLVVQNSLDARDLGVATASHQFARTLGGTIGIGVAGGLVSYFIKASLLAADGALGSPGGAHADLSKLLQNLQSLFSPEVQAGLSETAKTLLSQAVASGLEAVFWIATIASGLSLIMNVLMPASTAAVAPSKLHSHQFTAPE